MKQGDKRMKKLIIALVVALMPLSVFADSIFESVKATVKDYRVSSPELAGVQAWRYSLVHFDEGDPTTANRAGVPMTCTNDFHFETSNTAIALAISDNLASKSLTGFVIEDTQPLANKPCWVRLVVVR